MRCGPLGHVHGLQNEIIWIARGFDKLGNGIQASPREASIGDWANSESLGKSYGINKALGMLGSSLGTLLLVLFFYHYSNFSIHIIFAVSGFLALVSFVILLLGV